MEISQEENWCIRFQMEGNSNTPTLKEKETCETKKYLRQDELDEKFYQSIRDLMEAEVAAVSGLTYIQKFVTPGKEDGRSSNLYRRASIYCKGIVWNFK